MEIEFLFEDQIRLKIINGEHYRLGRSTDVTKGVLSVSVWADKAVWHKDLTMPSGKSLKWVRVHTWGRDVTLHEVHYRPATK